jgi:hypothetical protein
MCELRRRHRRAAGCRNAPQPGTGALPLPPPLLDLLGIDLSVVTMLLLLCVMIEARDFVGLCTYAVPSLFVSFRLPYTTKETHSMCTLVAVSLHAFGFPGFNVPRGSQPSPCRTLSQGQPSTQLPNSSSSSCQVMHTVLAAENTMPKKGDTWRSDSDVQGNTPKSTSSTGQHNSRVSRVSLSVVFCSACVIIPSPISAVSSQMIAQAPAIGSARISR